MQIKLNCHADVWNSLTPQTCKCFQVILRHILIGFYLKNEMTHLSEVRVKKLGHELKSSLSLRLYTDLFNILSRLSHFFAGRHLSPQHYYYNMYRNSLFRKIYNAMKIKYPFIYLFSRDISRPVYIPIGEYN